MLLCALVVGAIVLFAPSGGPWMSQEGFISAMGLLLTKNIAINLLFHFVLVLAYGWIVATAIYRLKTAAAIVLGTALSLPLFGLNYLIFVFLLRYQSSELHVFLAHLEFCLFSPPRTKAHRFRGRAGKQPASR